MEQRVFEGTWEEMSLHAKELSGQRVRVTVLDNEEAPTLDQTLSELIKAAEVLEPKGQELMSSDLPKDIDQVVTDAVIDKYKKQGFDL